MLCLVPVYPLQSYIYTKHLRPQGTTTIAGKHHGKNRKRVAYVLFGHISDRVSFLYKGRLIKCITSIVVHSLEVVLHGEIPVLPDWFVDAILYYPIMSVLELKETVQKYLVKQT